MSETETESDLEKQSFSKAYAAEESTVALKDDHHIEQVVDYEPTRLSTVMLFFTLRGTVLANPFLWVEQLIIIILCLIHIRCWIVHICVVFVGYVLYIIQYTIIQRYVVLYSI